MIGGTMARCSRKVPAMTNDPTGVQAAFHVVDQEVRVWRRAHPEATLTEIERELDSRLHTVRAALLIEVAGDGVAADRCPACGGPLIRRGARSRTLTTQGDAPLPLTRFYATCPACGHGLFPPR